jgi:hypothetical protein
VAAAWRWRFDELFVLRVLEPLVDNRGIGWQRNSVQIDDFSIDDQLDSGKVI